MSSVTTTFDPLCIPLSGVHSIAASAGTGKTFSITTLYLRYILETNCRVDDILATTFTEAATAELKERLRNRLNSALELIRKFDSLEAAELKANSGQADVVLVRLLSQAGAWDGDIANVVRERLENAILDFDHAPIFTIHGFCNRILQEQVFETSSRFQAELVTSVEDLVHKAMCDFVSKYWTGSDAPLAKWLDVDDTLWGSMRKLVLDAIENPLANIVPAQANLEELLDSLLIDDFSDVAAPLIEIWNRDRTEICNMLFEARDNGWLHGNTHGRAGQLERSIEIIDSFAVDPTPDVFKRIEPDHRRLAQSSLENGILIAHAENTPRHQAFEEIDNILERVAEIEKHRSDIFACLLARLAHETRDQIINHKRDLGVMTFSDLLHQVDQALAGPQGNLLLNVLRQRYRVALVDEFQDTDPVQYRIFHRIFHETTRHPENDVRAFIMIGDVKQSIFRFRGADIDSYLSATEATPEENRHPMDTNWRSDESLVRAVQAVFASRPDPFLSDRISLPSVKARYGDRFGPGPGLQLTFVPRHRHAAPNKALSPKKALEQIVRRATGDIVAQLQDPPTISQDDGTSRVIAAGDIAILCRTGKQLREFQAKLAHRGVPAVLQTEESVFDTFEAEAMAFLLRALVTPPRQQALLNALATPIFSFSAVELQNIQQDDSALSTWYEHFRSWHELWHQHGFIVMWRHLVDHQDTIAKLAGRTLGERQVTNFVHLSELLHGRVVSDHAGPAKLLRWLEAGIANPDRRGEDENQLRLETDADAIQLCTIHKSKGLEYPIVYCPTLWHVPQFPIDKHVVARFDANGVRLENSEIDVGSPLIEDRHQKYKLEGECEDRRLLYVALTRARHQCRIYWTAVSSAAKSALGQIMLPNLNANHDDITIENDLRTWAENLNVNRVEFAGAIAHNQFNDCGSYVRPQTPGVELANRTSVRRLIPPLVQTSFSALSRAAGPFSHTDFQDRDEIKETADLAKSPGADSKEATERVPLADVRGGRKLGNLVHDALENLLNSGKLPGADRDAIRSAVADQVTAGLNLNNLDSSSLDILIDSMTDWLTGSLRADGFDFRLADLSSDNLTCEMPFLLRVADSQRDADLTQIASAFQMSDLAVVREYAPRLKELKRSRLRGFLAGFIDLVFFAEGRWYLLDYKTNNLGGTFGDYATAHLESTMAHHDYILQYHLYTLALDLFLKQRISGYDYDRDFGGAIYFFVRGYQADADQSTGIFFDRPRRSVVEALASTLEGFAT